MHAIEWEKIRNWKTIKKKRKIDFHEYDWLWMPRHKQRTKQYYRLLFMCNWSHFHENQYIGHDSFVITWESFQEYTVFLFSGEHDKIYSDLAFFELQLKIVDKSIKIDIKISQTFKYYGWMKIIGTKET